MKKLLYLTTAALALITTTTYANDNFASQTKEPTFGDLLANRDREIGVSRVVIDQYGNLVKLDKQNIYVHIKKGLLSLIPGVMNIGLRCKKKTAKLFCYRHLNYFVI